MKSVSKSYMSVISIVTLITEREETQVYAQTSN